MMETTAGSSTEMERLEYLNATRLEGPVPRFDHLTVLNSEGRRVGELDGVLIDPAERRLRYFVVDDTRHRYLLAAAPARIDTEQPALRVDVDSDDVTWCEDFDPAAFPRFSENGWLGAPRAADQL